MIDDKRTECCWCGHVGMIISLSYFSSIYIRWLLSSFFIPLHSFALASCVLFCPHFVVQGIEYYAFSQLSEKTGIVFHCSLVLLFGVIHCCCRKGKINWFCWIPRNLVSYRRGINPAFLTPIKTEICRNAESSLCMDKSSEISVSQVSFHFLFNGTMDPQHQALPNNCATGSCHLPRVLILCSHCFPIWNIVSF